MGALSLGLWAVAVLALITSTGVLSGLGVITKNIIFYGSLIAPCVAGAYVSVRGWTPVKYWEAVSDSLFWGGILAYPTVFLGMLVWQQIF